MMINVENTRAEGYFTPKVAESTPKMPEKPINTRAEGTQENAGEKEHMKKIKLFIECMRNICKSGGCTDEKLKDMYDTAEAIKWNIECIQKIRKEEQGH